MKEELLKKTSANYQLSGGQIMNVKKRCVSEQILFDRAVYEDSKFISYIEEEIYFREAKQTKIGFS